MTCGPSGPPSPCLLGLSWPPVKRRRSAGRPSWQQLWNVLCWSTSSTTIRSRMVSAYSARPGGDQETPSTGRSRTRRSPTSKLLVPPRRPGSIHSSRCTRWRRAQQQHGKTPQSPGRPHRARLVPRHAGPLQGQNDDGACSVAWVKSSDFCPGMFDGINPNSTSYRWKTERALKSSTARQEKYALARRHDTADASTPCE